MRSTDAIQIEGRVVEILSERLVRLELGNGHRVMGFLTRGDGVWKNGFEIGEKLTIEMWPSDFSKGRIRILKT